MQFAVVIVGLACIVGCLSLSVLHLPLCPCHVSLHLYSLHDCVSAANLQWKGSD